MEVIRKNIIKKNCHTSFHSNFFFLIHDKLKKNIFIDNKEGNGKKLFQSLAIKKGIRYYGHGIILLQI